MRTELEKILDTFSRDAVEASKTPLGKSWNDEPRKIRNLVLDAIEKNKVTINKGGSGEMTFLDETLLRQNIEVL